MNEIFNNYRNGVKVMLNDELCNKKYEKTDKPAMDFWATGETGIHVSIVEKLRDREISKC